MNDGMLSQEEINALLNADTDSSEKQQTPAENELFLSDNEKDTLGEIGNISMGSAATTLSILLGHKVNITTPRVVLNKMDDIRDQYPMPYLLIAVDYTTGFKGSNLFAIKEKDALIIADLMMGEDGTNPPTELSELYMSAVSEAMNQMMGATATAMSTVFKEKIDIAPPDVSLVDFTNDEKMADVAQATPDPVVKISFRMEVSDLIDSEIMQIITVSVAKELVAKLMKPNEQPPASTMPQQQVTAQTTTQQAVSSAAPQQAMAYMPPKPSGPPVTAPVHPVQFTPLSPQAMPAIEGNIGLLMDVPMQITVELGRTKKVIKDILDLGAGSVIELDKLAGEPVDIFVNTKLIAKGEVVVIDENFGVRITEIVNPMDRILNLQ